MRPRKKTMRRRLAEIMDKKEMSGLALTPDQIIKLARSAKLMPYVEPLTGIEHAKNCMCEYCAR
jgi:hypothetical protein